MCTAGTILVPEGQIFDTTVDLLQENHGLSVANANEAYGTNPENDKRNLKNVDTPLSLEGSRQG